MTTAQKQDGMMDDADGTPRLEHVLDHAESLGKTDILTRVNRALELMYPREILRMMIEHMPDEYEQLDKEATGGEFGDHFPPAGIPGRGDCNA